MAIFVSFGFRCKFAKPCERCSFPRAMKVTLGDVAENAGVSQATASRVLNGKGASPSTRRP